MSLGVTAFLIVYMLCQNARASPIYQASPLIRAVAPPQNGAYLIAAAGAGMVIAGSIEFLLCARPPSTRSTLTLSRSPDGCRRRGDAAAWNECVAMACGELADVGAVGGGSAL